MNETKITFFMIVTDRDVVIADYAVRSYSKIKNLTFKLRIYSNWVSSALKKKYFPTWRKYEFVEIIEYEWQTDEKKPTDSKLEGPFEKCATVWDRELKKIQTPYHATVDADFEILDAKFISVMLEKLEKNPNLVAISTDRPPGKAEGRRQRAEGECDGLYYNEMFSALPCPKRVQAPKFIYEKQRKYVFRDA